MLDDGIRLSFDDIDVRDFVTNRQKYDWKIDWEFKGSRYASLAGGYGGDINNEELYLRLGDDFITRYFDYDYKDTFVSKKAERYLESLNDELFGITHAVNEMEDDYSKLKEKENINLARYEGAERRLIDIESVENELQDDIENLYSTAKLTKSGAIDKRTKAFTAIMSIEEELFNLRSISKTKAEQSYSREVSRYMNSSKRREQAYVNIMNYINDKEDSYSAEMENKGIEIAEEIRDDIIRSAENGTLPLATHSLSARTKEERRKAGLPETPRFYASGQFINSIAIVAKIRKVTA